MPARHECLYWLLSMSLTGTLAGLAVWLAGRWKRLPRRIAHGLWIVPLLRLTLPVGLASPASLLALLPESAVATVPLPAQPALTTLNCLLLADDYAPVAFRDSRLLAVFSAAWWVWLAGCAMMTAVLLLAWLANRRDAVDAVPVADGVYRSARVTSPAVYGIRRPRILIPDSLPEDRLAPILAHERTHIRRLDNLWRLIALLTASLHWFNPAVWMMLRAFLRETELACDESAVARMDAPERRAYAHALVDAAVAPRALVSPFGGSPLKHRIAALCSFRRLTAGSLAALLVLAGALAWALLTNPA